MVVRNTGYIKIIGHFAKISKDCILVKKVPLLCITNSGPEVIKKSPSLA